jgi:hypothetical protein
MSKEQIIAQTRKVEAYKKVFGTDEGKLVLKELAAFCHMTNPTFTGDVNQTVFNEGKRNVYLYINHFINVDLNALITSAERQSE